jgi:hypothetical protein
MTTAAKAIVRGPMPYFGKDSVLYMPGQIVTDVPANEVSEDSTRDIKVEVEARNGDLRERTVAKPVPFLPLKAGEPTISGPVDTAEVATGNPDRLNVTDFLKQGDDEIVAAIVSGSVDDHLGAIEQAAIAGKGRMRSAVRDALAARQAVNHR